MLSDSKAESTNLMQCLPGEHKTGMGSKTIGRKNKLDEILHRTQKERHNRGRRRWRAGERGRSKGEQVAKESDDKGNVLSDIMAAQEKTSMKVKTEANHNTPELIKRQIHEFNGITYPFAETGNPINDYTSPTEDTNVCYSLWRLGKKLDPNPVQKIEKSLPDDSLRVLVRSGIHGARLETDSNNQDELYPQYYTIDCKVENQVKFGAEIMTKAEIAKQWIATMLRPNSKLARLRVNAANADVLMVENKTLKDLTNDGLKVGFKPDESLGNLFTLFSELKKLPIPTEKENGIARYLMRHDSNTGAFVEILKSVDSCQLPPKARPSIVDVHAAYNNRSNEEIPLPSLNSRWLSIDAELVTPYHNINSKVPCLFSPKPFKNNLRGRGRGRGKRDKRSN